jgi:hypothetical protein
MRVLVRCATAMRSISIRARLTCRGGGFFLGAISGKGKGPKVRVRFSISIGWRRSGTNVNVI